MGKQWRATYELYMDGDTAPRAAVERSIEGILDRFDGVAIGHLRLVIDVYEVGSKVTTHELAIQAETERRLGLRD